MNILFDILHPADINLFKNLTFRLRKENHQVFIIFRDRGALESILRKELPDFNITKIGQHKKRFISKILGGINREFRAFKFLKNNNINIMISQGLASGFACRLLNIKILHYDDDCEYKFTFYLGKFLSDIDLVPSFMPVKGQNIVKYKGYKELAYLHPTYFKPAEHALEKYNINPYDYVFVREISNVSLNYQNKNESLSLIIKHLLNINLKIILSLEDKTHLNKYGSSCIILEEPIEDLYSIVSFAKFVISSGDTMAREACLLGVPCIYTGGRQMFANKFFVENRFMYQVNETNQLFTKIDELSLLNTHSNLKLSINNIIFNKFDDTNNVLYTQVSKLIAQLN